MKIIRTGVMTMVFTGFLSLLGLYPSSVEAKSVSEPIVVQEGDSLEKIAKKHGSTTEMWKKANHLEDHYLTLGQTLNIVFPYRVQAGDQLDYLAEKYNTTQFAIKKLNHIEYENVEAGMIISIPVNSNKMSKERELLAEKNMEKRATEQKQVKQAKKTTQKKPIKTKATLSGSKKQTAKKDQSTQLNTAGKSSLQMKATAYNIEGNEQWGNLTYIGTTVRHGVVAVDPKVIPLGTKLYITGYDSPLLPKGGFVAVAEDVGGAIKGNRIDIYIEAPTGQLKQFGIQNVKVTILK